MKNIRKYKLLALVSLCLMAIIAFTACAPTGANKNAASANGEWGDIKWEYESSSKTLTLSGSGSMNAILSADEIPWATAYMSATDLVVKEGITSISDYAFYGFGALKKVTLPEGLTSIGKLSFAFCGQLETLSLPASLSTVGESAFEWCASLKSVNLGSNLSELGARAFAYCTSLESAYLCSADLEIKDEAFRKCDKLGTLVLHPSLEGKVNGHAFDEGFDIASISYKESANDEIKITVNYVTADGTKLAEPKTETVKIGEAYSITTPVIEGYSPDAAVVEGVAAGSDETFTVTFTLIPVETESETKPVETEPTEPAKKPSVIPVILLVALVAAIGVGAYFLVKSNKKETERQKNQNKAKNRKQK